MVYDWRGVESPGHVRFADAETGEPVTHVFYYDTLSCRLGRYLLDAAGKPFRSGDAPALTWETRRLAVTEVATDG